MYLVEALDSLEDAEPEAVGREEEAEGRFVVGQHLGYKPRMHSQNTRTHSFNNSFINAYIGIPIFIHSYVCTHKHQ